jgi:hypothetical protein
MAHGFRYIPKRRTAAPEPDGPHCSYCGARTDLGPPRHICKEVTFGTPLSPTPFLSLDGETEDPPR